jgi:chaperonin GroES
MSTVSKMKPLSDRVIVKPLEQKEVKKGGIIIPDTAKEKPMEGEVIAVGPGKVNDSGTRMAMDVKKGDKILYGKYSGTEVRIDDVEYLIMHVEDIMAVIHDEK